MLNPNDLPAPFSHPEILTGPAQISIQNFNLWYGKAQALHNINLPVLQHAITSFIGPSGCGKSTLLRSINRLNDLIDNISVTGDIKIGERSVYERHLDVTSLRKRIGMVFQKSNPFPMSIYENVCYPLRISGISQRNILDEAVETSLRSAALWDEVKDRLKRSALDLSGGQQQRLCIARAIAGNPEVLLMDEPCSALDPISTAKIEELIAEMRGRFTVVIVTHSMSQASRVSDQTAFFYLGRLIEAGPTKRLFESPHTKATQDYISGRFG
ncbi:MAG: phosphate ABC transporter ATP-binding protein [Proteobacteria bacterium]|nr:phosphate ABC transporter ATP-binding protein [Pseudomonadota bacterium]